MSAWAGRGHRPEHKNPACCRCRCGCVSMPASAQNIGTQPSEKIVYVCEGNRPDGIVVIQKVLPVVVDQSSQFQRVPPARIKEITAPGEDPLREVIWSSVQYHTCYTANIDGSDFFSLNKRILRADQARRRRILGVCSAK